MITVYKLLSAHMYAIHHTNCMNPQELSERRRRRDWSTEKCSINGTRSKKKPTWVINSHGKRMTYTVESLWYPSHLRFILFGHIGRFGHLKIQDNTGYSLFTHLSLYILFRIFIFKHNKHKKNPKTQSHIFTVHGKDKNVIRNSYTKLNWFKELLTDY